MSIPTTPPSGFRDFLPEECARRARTEETISRVYRSFGFMSISTSAVEDLEVLTGKGIGENEKLLFKILKRGEKLEEARSGGELADLGLRFDLTLPLARYYSRFGGRLPHPFKAFQIGPVWRAERAQKGRYRQFYQCDADIIGTDSWTAEVEVISAILAAFKALGISEVEVLINDRSLVYAVLEHAGVPQPKWLSVCIALDKLDKVPAESVKQELFALAGDDAARRVEALLITNPPSKDLYQDAGAESFARIERIADALAGERVKISPSLMRGLDYYTGPIFEFRHPKLSGSLGGGGRYDRLTEKFGGKAVPACGASIGFERLMLLLEESGTGGDGEGPDAVVTVFSEELRGKSLEAASALRSRGWSVDLYAGTGKLSAQFKYADMRGAALAVVIGPDEAAAGKVKVKDLKTGVERLESLESLLQQGRAP